MSLNRGRRSDGGLIDAPDHPLELLDKGVSGCRQHGSLVG
jgi:hypothetical protein